RTSSASSCRTASPSSARSAASACSRPPGASIASTVSPLSIAGKSAAGPVFFASSPAAEAGLPPAHSRARIPSRRFAPEARCPLVGVRILDLSRVTAGFRSCVAWALVGAQVVLVQAGEELALRVCEAGGVVAKRVVYARRERVMGLILREAEARD